MSKRFTDTNKWRKEFIRGLQGPYKLLWLYILDECDHAGIWNVELDVASLRIGFEIDPQKAEEYLGDHIVVFDKKTKWFIPDFIEFQYGELNPENRAHQSVLCILERYKLKGLARGLQGRKDKDKEMDMDKEKEIFEIFRKNYPGTKRGFTIEFENFTKKHKDWREVLPTLSDCLAYQNNCREDKKAAGGFVPEWKNLKTWINQRCWEEEIGIDNTTSNGKSTNNKGATDREFLNAIAPHLTR